MKKESFKKILAYVCAGALALSLIPAGQHFATSVKAADELGDEIVLDGDDSGASSMIGEYSYADDGYHYLGFATFGPNVTANYTQLKITYTGNITQLRFEFEHVANSDQNGEPSEKSLVYWFNKDNLEDDANKNFVTADGTDIPLVGDNTTVTLDLTKSGVDIGTYNSGIHMHADSMQTNGSFTISDARLIKTSETVPETTPRPTQAPTERPTPPPEEPTMSPDDRVLNGDDNGASSMLGTFTSTTDSYKYLGFVTFGDNVTSDYRYLFITYTGNITQLRFQFEHVANTDGKNEPQDQDTVKYWFNKDTVQDVENKIFLTADGSDIPLNGNKTTVVIDLQKSGVDIGRFNSGLHMHADLLKTNGPIQIINARLSKLPDVLSSDKTEAPTKAVPATAAPKGQSKNVKVKKVKIGKVSRAKNGRKAKITLKKIKGVKGYQVKYSTSKKFKKKATKTKTFAKAKFTIKKLKAGKKYFIKARAYKVKGGKKYYGKWSKVRVLKVKK